MDAIESELARAKSNPQHDLVPGAFESLIDQVCRRLFAHFPESDTTPVAKKGRYVGGFLRHAIMLVDMYVLSAIAAIFIVPGELTQNNVGMARFNRTGPMT